jgi:hypothetical protein
MVGLTWMTVRQLRKHTITGNSPNMNTLPHRVCVFLFTVKRFKIRYYGKTKRTSVNKWSPVGNFGRVQIFSMLLFKIRNRRTRLGEKTGSVIKQYIGLSNDRKFVPAHERLRIVIVFWHFDRLLKIARSNSKVELIYEWRSDCLRAACGSDELEKLLSVFYWHWSEGEW